MDDTKYVEVQVLRFNFVGRYKILSVLQFKMKYYYFIRMDTTVLPPMKMTSFIVTSCNISACTDALFFFWLRNPSSLTLDTAVYN
jgi:hypothetical protein